MAPQRKPKRTVRSAGSSSLRRATSNLALADSPRHGTATCAELECTYTLRPAYGGPDTFTFTFTLTDAAVTTEAAT